MLGELASMSSLWGKVSVGKTDARHSGVRMLRHGDVFLSHSYLELYQAPLTAGALWCAHVNHRRRVFRSSVGIVWRGELAVASYDPSFLPE